MYPDVIRCIQVQQCESQRPPQESKWVKKTDEKQMRLHKDVVGYCLHSGRLGKKPYACEIGGITQRRQHEADEVDPDHSILHADGDGPIDRRPSTHCDGWTSTHSVLEMLVHVPTLIKVGRIRRMPPTHGR